MKVDGSLARNIDFEVADFRLHWENWQEHVDFVATTCEHTGGSKNAKMEIRKNGWFSMENFVKWMIWGYPFLGNVHLRKSRLDSLVFLWRRRAYGERL